MYPYSEDQVGKGDLKIPPEVLEKGPILECELQPGDVLYMPRGFVHEACCGDTSSSWHATCAVATHDWSWTKVYTAALTAALDADPCWRAAVPLGLGMVAGGTAADESDCEAKLAELAQVATQRVNVASLRRNFTEKLERHNHLQQQGINSFHTSLRDFTNWAANNRDSPSLDCGILDARLVTQDVKLRPCCSGLPCLGLQVQARRQNGQGKGCGKGAGKGARGGQLFVREGLVRAVTAVLQDLETCEEHGRCVSDFGRAPATAAAPGRGADAAEPLQSQSGLFDDLARVCLARVCVYTGSAAVVEPAAEGPPC